MSLHICAPAPTGYIVRVRRRRARSYEIHEGDWKNEAEAIADLAQIMAKKGHKRGDVWARYEWYDPSLIIEMVVP